jgi:hypothetical protein
MADKKTGYESSDEEDDTMTNQKALDLMTRSLDEKRIIYNAQHQIVQNAYRQFLNMRTPETVETYLEAVAEEVKLFRFGDDLKDGNLIEILYYRSVILKYLKGLYDLAKRAGKQFHEMLKQVATFKPKGTPNEARLGAKQLNALYEEYEEVIRHIGYRYIDYDAAALWFDPDHAGLNTTCLRCHKKSPP